MNGIVAIAMKNSAKCLVVSIVAAAAAGAHAQYQIGNQAINLGASVGYLYPQSTALKAAFGKEVIHIGVTPVNNAQKQEGVVPGWEVISASKNGSHMFIVPITYGIQKSLGDNVMFQPYYRIFAGYAYMDYNIGGTSSKGFNPTWGAELGATVIKNGSISARYNGFNNRSGLNFNNIEVSLTYSLFKL